MVITYTRYINIFNLFLNLKKNQNYIETAVYFRAEKINVMNSNKKKLNLKIDVLN